MSRPDEILALLKAYLSDIDEDPIKAEPGAKLEEIGIDSLMAVDLVFKLEEHFKVELEPADFRGVTVDEAIALVIAKLPPKENTGDIAAA